MTRPKKPKEPEILNPLYEGSTPELVALALLKHKPKGGDGRAKPSRVIADRRVRSSI